jgi:hypothetical protein
MIPMTIYKKEGRTLKAVGVLKSRKKLAVEISSEFKFGIEQLELISETLRRLHPCEACLLKAHYINGDTDDVLKDCEKELDSELILIKAIRNFRRIYRRLDAGSN